MKSTLITATATAAVLSMMLPALPTFGENWPMWGRDASRNMAGHAENLPLNIEAGQYVGRSDEIDSATTKQVKWIAKLGSQAYGNPSVSGGRVFVGTNNESPRDPRIKGDHSMLMVFDEQTGAFQWQLSVPKLGAGKVSDWEFLGICSSPAVDGDRVYVVTSRCEVLALDVKGMSNGNDGPFKSEGKYMAGSGSPMELGSSDADILWVYDMREQLGVFPHNVTSSSVLVTDDALFITTSNGVDWSHINIPNPTAPALIKLDKTTGELLGEEGSGISTRLMHSNWSSPAAGEVNGKQTVFFAAGDGFCYAFNPKPELDDEGFAILPERWRSDANPQNYRFDEEGNPRKYATPPGPSECIGTPVLYDNKIYVTIGQDPEHGTGVGALNCFDAATGERLWRFTDIERSMSTPSIVDGVVYIADYSGHIFAVDAKTGEQYWIHDTLAHNWASTLVADGKVFLGNEDGILTILEASKTKNLLAEVEFGAPIYASPIVANGVLYVQTMTHLYAIAPSAGE